MNELLCEILSICYKLSTETKADCFFHYYPHTNGLDIYYHPDGWSEGLTVEEYTANKVSTGEITEENLKNTLHKLKWIAVKEGIEV